MIGCEVQAPVTLGDKFLRTANQDWDRIGLTSDGGDERPVALFRQRRIRIPPVDSIGTRRKPAIQINLSGGFNPYPLTTSYLHVRSDPLIHELHFYRLKLRPAASRRGCAVAAARPVNLNADDVARGKTETTTSIAIIAARDLEDEFAIVIPNETPLQHAPIAMIKRVSQGESSERCRK
jgi:hypothetical protein